MSDLLTRYRALKNGSITSNSVGSDTQETEEVNGTPTTTSGGSSTLLTRYRNLKANTELTNTLPTVTPENRDTSWLNLPTNFLQESLGMLGGISQAAYGFGAEALGRIAHPIEKGIPGVKSDIASVGNLLGTTFEGIIDPNGPSKVFTNPIESTKEAMSALGQLRELQKEDPKRLEQAFSNVEQTYLQAEDLPLLTKMVGGIWFDTAETLTKLASQPKQTIVNEPLRTTLNLMNFGTGGLGLKPIKGLEGLFGASAKELGVKALSKIGKENALGRTITGMQDYLKTKTLKKEYSALDYKRMDEWFDYRNDLIKSNFEAFEKHLTPDEKKFFPYYAKGLKPVPVDASPELRLALTKANEIGKLSGEALVRNGVIPRSVLEERRWAPIKARIGYSKFGKTLDQLDDVEKAAVDSALASAKDGINPFYYPAIQKNNLLGYLFPSKKVSKYKPGFAKQFTGKSELFPESFFQSPFQVMTRNQLAVNKYLFDIDTMNTTLKKFGKPIQLGDDVLPGHVVIAPEGYTALVDPTKTSADILESIMTDPNIDFNSSLFGKSVEEVSSKLGLDLTDLASQTRPIRFYQVPKFVASDIQKKIAGSAFRKELRNADNFGEVMDAIWNNKTEAFLLSRKSLLGLFKKVVLGYYPLRWMKNNLMGNIVFAAMEGLNPKDFLESFKMAKGKGVYKNLMEATNPDGALPLTSKSVEPLFAEARKYKSADEFVKAQGTPVYHGSPSKIIGELKSSKELGTSQHTSKFGGVFFSENKAVADAYSKLPNRANLSQIKRSEVSNYVDRLQKKITEYNNTVDELYQRFDKQGWIVDNNFERYVSAERGGKPIKDKIVKIQNEIRDIKKNAPDLTDTEKSLLYGNANTQEVVLIGDVIDINKRVGFSENREALIEKYKGKIIKLKDGNNQVEYIATEPSQIKTKSQLEEIWKKANKNVDIEPLLQEAKKYKSADEFVKAQPKLYHGTNQEITSFNQEKSGSKRLYSFLAEDKNVATEYANQAATSGGKPTIIEATHNGNLLDFTKLKNTDKLNIAQELRDFIKNGNYENTSKTRQAQNFVTQLESGWQPDPVLLAENNVFKDFLQSRGNDGYAVLSDGKKFIAVENSKIQTKSQLTDIYNQSNNPRNVLEIQDVAQLPDNVRPFLNNVNRYKSASSFARAMAKVLPDQSTEELTALYRRFKAYRPSTEAIQELPKFERAGVSLQEYQRGLSELLGIPEDKLKAFLPQGVESGLGKTEMDRVLNNFYSTEDTSSRMQKGWQVFKDGFNFIPNKTFAANTKLENFFRRASYYHAVSKLAKDVLKKTGREVNPQTILDEVVSNPAMQESALKEVNQFFGEYLSKTTGDQAIPFVRFYKHVFNLALKYPMQFPGRAVLIKQLDLIQDSVDEEIRKTEVLPDYLQAANNIPIVVGGVPYRMRTASSDPFGALDLTDIKPIAFTGFEPVDLIATALLRQAAPDIKVVAERFKQYDLFRQQPFSSEEQQKYYNAKAVPDLDKHILKQLPGFSDARKLWDAIKYWKKTGKFEVPARNALDEVYTDSSGNPMYTNSEWLELLKTIGINLVPEDDYQNQVEKELNDLKDQQIIEDRNTIQ